MSGWPVAADYDEAIQNPHLNFDDRELKEGEPEYDPYGSPAVRSGNFASVYMLQGPKRKIAVRCFLREIPDQQERYQAISRDLLGLGLPYTVNFEFLSKGIKVQGEWFPVLKMDWCDGEQLDKYLERNLDNQAKVRRLADKWFEMSHSLRKVGIAHGDLSHGNIMVQDDEFKLIDYDGMFVPRLAGRKSNERGLEHYQHPGRTDNHFGRYLDNFSNWVMYTTLVGLGEDRELWNLVNIADKHLIFSKNDFEHPSRSKTFDILKSHEDKTLRTYATTVENLLQYDVEQIPDFHPDKPVLYPPEAFQQKRLLAQAWETGAVCSNRWTIKLSATVVDCSIPEHRKGNEIQVDCSPNLLSQTMCRVNQARHQAFHDSEREISPVQIGVAALAVVAIAVTAWFGITKLMPPTESTESALLSGINSIKMDAPYDARRQFKDIYKNEALDPKIRSKAYTLAGLTYAKEGLSKQDKGKLGEATELFTNAIKFDPNNAEAFFDRGKVFEAIKNYSEARRDYESSRSIDDEMKESKEALKNLNN